jgi:O-antigen/teichoic acid export membrane protein
VNDNHNLFRKGGIFAAVDAIGKLMALAVVVILTRRESAYTFGVIVAGISAASMVQCVVDGGLGTALARAVARDDTAMRVLAGSKVTMTVLASIPCLAVILAPHSVLAIPLAALACGATGALLLVPALLAAHRLMYASIALTGPNALFVALLLLLPALNAVEVLYLFAGCNALCALVTLRASEVRPRAVSPLRTARLYRRHLAKGIYILTSTIYGRLDTVILALVGAVAAAGLYGTYFRVVLAAVGLVSWISALALRMFTEPDRMQTRVLWLERRLAGIAAAVSLVLIAAGPWILKMLTHGGSLPSPAFVFLGLLPLPAILAAPLSRALIMNFRSRRLAWISVCLLGVACGLYLALIPLVGTSGAAFASLMVETLAFAWTWREVLMVPPKLAM